MTTPIFYLDQDENNLLIHVKALYGRQSELDVFFADKEFLFHCPPYFLRLFLPGEVEEYEGECVSYNPNDNIYTIRAPKKVAGQHFPDLDMITKLLIPTDNLLPPPVDTEQYYERVRDAMKSRDRLRDANNVSTNFHYGFANRYIDVFSTLGEEANSIVDIVNPDQHCWQTRAEMLQSLEESSFSESVYLADLHNEDVKEMMGISQPWKIKLSVDPLLKDGVYSVQEIDRLKNLPKKTYSLDGVTEREVLCSLVDILYAFLYDCRVNMGDDCVESGWNIRKVSATLSGLLRFKNTREALKANVRRSLCYPYVRRFDFSMQIISDLSDLFAAGKVTVLKSLLCIHKIFANTGEYMYLFNDLYVTDLCVWFQALHQDKVDDVCREISKANVSMADVGFELDLIELAAKLALEDLDESCPDEEGEKTTLSFLCKNGTHAKLDNCCSDELNKSMQSVKLQ